MGLRACLMGCRAIMGGRRGSLGLACSLRGIVWPMLSGRSRLVGAGDLTGQVAAPAEELAGPCTSTRWARRGTGRSALGCRQGSMPCRAATLRSGGDRRRDSVLIRADTVPPCFASRFLSASRASVRAACRHLPAFNTQACKLGGHPSRVRAARRRAPQRGSGPTPGAEVPCTPLTRSETAISHPVPVKPGA